MTIRLSTELVRPSQTEFYPNHLIPLIRAWQNGEENKIPPPAVRRFGNRYLTLDGHHRLLAADLFGKEIDVFVAESEYSGIKYLFLPFPIQKLHDTASFIGENFNYVLESERRLRSTPHQSFRSWRQYLGLLDTDIQIEKIKSLRL